MGSGNDERERNKNVATKPLIMGLYGQGHGILGLPLHLDWRWLAVGASTAYLIFSYQNGQLLNGAIIWLLVVLWIRNS